ncbi:ABC-ATPase domain-containing protein [Acetatifactor muris]|uniref:Putative ATPase of the ABC class n=1 Tax=Acetatifactor muris TaxID=879566 RepID=A0A2K4ZJ65_9FIRM|nr:ABC-ATPase domain-containing protein [Acetatifactor muris]MCR2045952.1 ABC-ATPase domain-containing protein [Acetatifactor muris]SOY30442.1 putative ATPase of the ABC class [Acetatifactor muris]
MKSQNELRTLLRSIDHKGYPAYKSLAGAWKFDRYTLVIDHVQGDPFASPSSLHVEIPHTLAKFPAAYYAEDCGRIALQDFLVRQVGKQFEQYNFRAKGSGKSGLLSISRCGQAVLERSACEITDSGLIVRFYVGFPAFGRTINAGELDKILFDFLPRCVESSLFYARLDGKRVESVVHLAEDQREVRRILKAEGLVAFVANGSVLPRKSGVSDLPMADSVPFTSPASMERTFRLPHRGEITGMAIPEGITLIVGGGYHGKSTLLEAIQMGVYDHIAGDGREFVITDDTALKLRAEDGRSIRNVDISLFINDLPNKKDTTKFTTEDASGSTSQAAAVVEGIEAGTRLFLIDEDTSATNFMVRDEFMQQVISRDKEPITPFLERAGELYEKAGISTILVAGSSGAFFYIADHILMMDCYRPVDITERVKGMCGGHTAPRVKAPGFMVPTFDRVLPAFRKAQKGRGRGWDGRELETRNIGYGGDAAESGSFSMAESSGAGGQGYRGAEGRGNGGDGRGYGSGEDRGHGGRGRGGNRGGDGRHEHMKTKSFGLESFSMDREEVNVRYLEQLLDTEQVNALAHLLRYGLEEVMDGRKTVRQTVESIWNAWEKQGWKPFSSSYVPCGLAKPRIQELYACLNRFRG